MDGLQRYCLLMTLVLLGGVAVQRCSPSLQASPSLVFGGTNHPVSSFRNQKGSFVLWQDGRITRVDGTSRDLGRPYREPLAGDIGAPPLEQQALEGAPSVAVGALVRSDGTYVLFADGSLRRPNDADAAAPAEESAAGSIGGWGWSSTDQSRDYQVTTTASELRVQFSESPESGSQGWGVGYLVGATTPNEQVFLYRRRPLQGNSLVLQPSATYIHPGARFDHGFFVVTR